MHGHYVLVNGDGEKFETHWHRGEGAVHSAPILCGAAFESAAGVKGLVEVSPGAKGDTQEQIVGALTHLCTLCTASVTSTS